MPIATNDAGEVLSLGQDGEWVPAQKAINPETGETLVLDGDKWISSPVQKDMGNTFIDDLGRGFADVATSGYADEITAGMEAMTGNLSDAVQGGEWRAPSLPIQAEGYPWQGSFWQASPAYERELAEERARDAAANPYARIPGQIAGAIAQTAALPAKTIVQGAGLVPRMADMGVKAGTQAAAYMSGTGKGGATNRLKEAGKGFLFGAPLGAAAVPVADTGSRLVRNLLEKYVQRQASGMSAPVYRQLERAAVSDDLLGRAGRANIQRAGAEGSLMDAGSTAQQMADYIVQKGGPGSRRIQEYVNNRLQGASQRVARTLDRTLGPVRGTREMGREISRQTAGARREAYEGIFNQTVDYTSEAGERITETLRRIPPRWMQRIVDEANDAMNLEHGFGRYRQILVQETADGGATLVEQPSVMQLDALKQGLQRMANQTDDLGRMTADATKFAPVARSLRRALGEAVEGYDDAMQIAGQKIARDNGLRLGRDLMRRRVTREVVAEQLRDAPEEVLQAVRAGARSQIDDVLAETKRAMSRAGSDTEIREAAKAVKDLSSRAVRDKLRLLLGEQEANALYRELDRAGTAFELAGSIATNSKTAAREMIDEARKRQSSAGTVYNLARGRIPEAIKSATESVTGAQRLQQIMDVENAELARYLTMNPRDTLRVMSLVNQSRQNIPPMARLSQRLLSGAGRYGSFAAVPPIMSPTQQPRRQ